MSYKIIMNIFKGDINKYHILKNWKINKATENLMWKLLKAGYANIYIYII